MCRKTIQLCKRRSRKPSPGGKVAERERGRMRDGVHRKSGKGLIQRENHKFSARIPHQSKIKDFCQLIDYGMIATGNHCNCVFAARSTTSGGSLGRYRAVPLSEKYTFLTVEIPRWVSASNHLKFHPHPSGMRLKFEGLSHELRKCPPDTFLPSLWSGRSFESLRAAKKQIPRRVSAFLVHRKGLEPPTLGTGIRCSIH